MLSLLVAAGAVTLLVTRGLQKTAKGGDFTLVHRGENWNLKSQARPLNILYIGYAKCPDVCPMSLSFTAQAIRRLGPEELARVKVLFLSVDADHDTPESVGDYASQFFPEFVGLTGSREEIDRVVNMVGASYVVEKDPNSYLGYSIAHTDRLFFLDAQGRVKDELPIPRSADAIVQKIKENL